MKKMIFIGILLVSGLFSLQYTLIVNYGWLPRKACETTVLHHNSCTHYEVIYICPSDSLAAQPQKVSL